MSFFRILVTHPKEWVGIRNGHQVLHVSIGGDKPKRQDGSITYDGIGEVATPSGIANLIQIASDFKPHIFLFGIHFGLTRDHIAHVKKLSGCKAVYHYTDQRDFLDPMVSQYDGVLDALLVTNGDQRAWEKYKPLKIPVGLFYDGFDPRVYNPSIGKSIPASSDVFFGGHNYFGLAENLKSRGQEVPKVILFPGAKKRIEIISRVNQDHELVIRGKWWPGNYNVKEMRYHPFYAQCMVEGKVILSTFNVKRRYLVTRRMVRSLAVGRPFVCERTSGIEEIFEEDKEILLYDSPEECSEKIKRILRNKKDYEKMVESAWNKIKSYTFENRFHAFVKLVEEKIL